MVTTLNNLHDYKLLLNGETHTSESRTELVRLALKAAKAGVSVTSTQFERRLNGNWQVDNKAWDMYQKALANASKATTRTRNTSPRSMSLKALAHITAVASRHSEELTDENIAQIHKAIDDVHTHFPRKERTAEHTKR